MARASTSPEVAQTAAGVYYQSTVFGLRNVPSECQSLQVDLIDAEPSRAAAGMARLANRGLFVSTTPLVAASEDRAVAPAVSPCNTPQGQRYRRSAAARSSEDRFSPLRPPPSRSPGSGLVTPPRPVPGGEAA